MRYGCQNDHLGSKYLLHVTTKNLLIVFGNQVNRSFSNLTTTLYIHPFFQIFFFLILFWKLYTVIFKSILPIWVVVLNLALWMVRNDGSIMRWSLIWCHQTYQSCFCPLTIGKVDMIVRFSTVQTVKFCAAKIVPLQNSPPPNPK